MSWLDDLLRRVRHEPDPAPLDAYLGPAGGAGRAHSPAAGRSLADPVAFGRAVAAIFGAAAVVPAHAAPAYAAPGYGGGGGAYAGFPSGYVAAPLSAFGPSGSVAFSSLAAAPDALAAAVAPNGLAAPAPPRLAYPAGYSPLGYTPMPDVGQTPHSGLPAPGTPVVDPGFYSVPTTAETDPWLITAIAAHQSAPAPVPVAIQSAAPAPAPAAAPVAPAPMPVALTRAPTVGRAAYS